MRRWLVRQRERLDHRDVHVVDVGRQWHGLLQRRGRGLVQRCGRDRHDDDDLELDGRLELRRGKLQRRGRRQHVGLQQLEHGAALRSTRLERSGRAVVPDGAAARSFLLLAERDGARDEIG